MKAPLLSFLFLLLTFAACQPVPKVARDEKGGAGDSKEAATTPEPGDPERKAILDVLRKEVKEIAQLDVVFVVEHLKVKDGWAWVDTLPQSPEGVSQYEDISALLRKEEDEWKILEIPTTDEDTEDMPDSLLNPDYAKLLKKRFPGLPEEILPEDFR